MKDVLNTFLGITFVIGCIIAMILPYFIVWGGDTTFIFKSFLTALLLVAESTILLMLNN